MNIHPDSNLESSINAIKSKCPTDYATAACPVDHLLGNKSFVSRQCDQKFEKMAQFLEKMAITVSDQKNALKYTTELNLKAQNSCIKKHF